MINAKIKSKITINKLKDEILVSKGIIYSDSATLRAKENHQSKTPYCINLK